MLHHLEAGASWVLGEGQQLSGRGTPGHIRLTGIAHSLPSSVLLPGILIGWTPKEARGTRIPLIVVHANQPSCTESRGDMGESESGRRNKVSGSQWVGL